MRWVGRPLLRYEDAVLLQGRGRFTADQARGARILRFVRSPVARGRFLTVNAPPEVTFITAAGLGDVKLICPRLDRPDYVPVAQPILADLHLLNGKLFPFIQTSDGSIDDYIDLQRFIFMLNENYRSKSFNVFGSGGVAKSFRHAIADFERQSQTAAIENDENTLFRVA